MPCLKSATSGVYIYIWTYIPSQSCPCLAPSNDGASDLDFAIGKAPFVAMSGGVTEVWKDCKTFPSGGPIPSGPDSSTFPSVGLFISWKQREMVKNCCRFLSCFSWLELCMQQWHFAQCPSWRFQNKITSTSTHSFYIRDDAHTQGHLDKTSFVLSESMLRCMFHQIRALTTVITFMTVIQSYISLPPRSAGPWQPLRVVEALGSFRATDSATPVALSHFSTSSSC